MAVRAHGRGRSFGEFVAIAYETCGEDCACGFVQLAFDAHLVRFQDTRAVRSFIKRIDAPVKPHENKTDRRH